MLPHVAEWRWLQGRDDTPWYRSMRLFRRRRGEPDWAGVTARIAAALCRDTEPHGVCASAVQSVIVSR
jgi:hypothetical protein